MICSDHLQFAALVAVLCFALTGGAHAQVPQAPRARTVGGIKPPLSVVPRLPARQAESAQQPWRRERTPAEKTPSSGLLDSIKGADAVIEVVLGQSRLLTLKRPIAKEDGNGVLAVTDPQVVNVDILPNPRMLRLRGTSVGVTDLTIVTDIGEAYSFQVHVVYDLPLLAAQLRQIFPDAMIRLKQLREHLVVEGQVRSTEQSARVLATIQAYLFSIQASQQQLTNQTGAGGTNDEGGIAPIGGRRPGEEAGGIALEAGGGGGGGGGQGQGQGGTLPQVINLLRVPGPQQVLLKVTIAELNRDAMREIGSDFSISGPNLLEVMSGSGGNIHGIFDSGRFELFFQAIRSNQVAKVLAEPNLVAMNGQVASFQSGGEFAVPVNQGGGLGNNTVEFKPFGILLNFVPFLQDDGVIRLQVSPEVSEIDFTLAAPTFASGSTPGVRTSNASTTVELREGQTLAIAGLLRHNTNATTDRIPLLGDLPILGVLFSNTRHSSTEQELLVTVTPYVISPMAPGQKPHLPGQDIMEPNEIELYLLGRIEGRTGQPHRSTTYWDNPFEYLHRMRVEQHQVFGPIGFSRQ